MTATPTLESVRADGYHLRCMKVEEIRALYNAVPFRPFRVHTASGKWVEVPHPEFMLLSQNGRRFTVEKMDDTLEIIDVSLVTSVETLPRNGAKKGRRKKPGR